jgi:ketosteroid isomerase-like protein
MRNADEVGIKRVIETYADRLRAADVGGTVALFTAHAAVMQPDQATAVGTQQLTAVYRAGFDAMTIDPTFDFEDILIKGDLAAVRTSSKVTVTIRATGQSMPAAFRELFVLERANGDWKIAQYMFQQLDRHEHTTA